MAESLLSSPAASSLTPFQLRVLRLTCKIPSGKVSTYGALATLLGTPRAAQAVGNALHANPFAPTVPCHRVVTSSLTIGGFEGVSERCGASKKKLALLSSEGVTFDDKGRLVGGAVMVWRGEVEEKGVVGGAGVGKKRARE
jgi:methylated-DNA-[protein]-cysteine S-methyltransferase